MPRHTKYIELYICLIREAAAAGEWTWTTASWPATLKFKSHAGVYYRPYQKDTWVT